MKLRNRILALVFANVGIFFVVAAFLPKEGSYSYSGPISKIVHSRDHWDIAFLVLAGTIALSISFLVLTPDEKRD